MKFNPGAHRRRSVRLKGWDYASRGAYFVTVCAHGRECAFGEVRGGRMILNEAGKMVEAAWRDLTRRFPDVEADAFVVMPNHVHGILILQKRRGESRIRPPESGGPSPSGQEGERVDRGEHKVRPYGTLPGTIGRIVQAFKSTVTHRYVAGVRENRWPPFSARLWQRNYYEHILRGGAELNRAREYVLRNPMKWAEDENHPGNARNRARSGKGP